MKGSEFIMPHLLSGMSPSESILVALSGGADSVYLLHRLIPYAQENGTRLFCAHLNHMIRGADADRDEAFCLELCQRLGIPCFTKRVDIPALCRERGGSTEEVARDQRYSFFFSIMKEHGIRILATAHNANDNVETLLFNISRGSGLSGIRGIAPSAERENGEIIIIRPIIREKKESILAYCKENSVEYVTDKTNFETEYTRNKIRLKVIPELSRISPSLTDNVWRLTESAREDLSFIEGLARDLISDHCGKMTCDDINGCHPSLSKRVISLLFSDVASANGRRATLERTHILSVLELCRKAAIGSRISLPDGVCAEIIGNQDGKAQLSFTLCDPSKREKKKRGVKIVSDEVTPLPIPEENGEISIDLGDLTVTAKRVSGESRKMQGSEKAFPNIYNASTYLLLKFDKISGSVYLRQRKSKDTILRGGINKKLRDIMSEAHLPLHLRDTYPVVCTRENDTEIILGIPGVCGAVRQGYGARQGYGDLLMVGCAEKSESPSSDDASNNKAIL